LRYKLKYLVRNQEDIALNHSWKGISCVSFWASNISQRRCSVG